MNQFAEDTAIATGASARSTVLPKASRSLVPGQ
jgi:hypothetical protein